MTSDVDVDQRLRLAAQIKGLELVQFDWLDFQYGKVLSLTWQNRKYKFGPFYIPKGATPEFVALLAKKVEQQAKANK